MIIISESFLENVRVRDNFIERVRASNIGIVESFVIDERTSIGKPAVFFIFFHFSFFEIDIKLDKSELFFYDLVT